jgi:hypothetical protein
MIACQNHPTVNVTILWLTNYALYNTDEGGVDVQIDIFFTLALVRSEWSASHLRQLYPEDDEETNLAPT